MKDLNQLLLNFNYNQNFNYDDFFVSINCWFYIRVEKGSIGLGLK